MNNNNTSYNNNIITKFAIVTQKTNLSIHHNKDVPSFVASEGKLNVAPGTLIKLHPNAEAEDSANGATATIGSKARSGNKLTTVQVIDYVQKQPEYENLYECPQNHLWKVAEDLWPFVIAIKKPERRVELVKDTAKCLFVRNLKRNEFVSVSGKQFGQPNANYNCIIRFIGNVLELHPVGYFFGLELLDLNHGPSPQSEDIPFSIQYMQTDPSLAIFTTADWISPISTEVKKKFSAKASIADVIGRVCTAIGPSTSNSLYQTATLRGSKKPKINEPNAQFYTSLNRNSLVQANLEAESADHQQVAEEDVDILDVGPREDQLWTKIDRESNQGDEDVDMDRDTRSMDNDEFKQSIAKYEHNLEKQHASGCSAVSAAAAAVAANPHFATAQVPLPSILKHRPALTASPSSITGGGGACGGSDRTDTSKSHSFKDREIIVINNDDIRESTKNQDNLIVVKSNGKDLCDLLGGEWPSVAGDAGKILNKFTKHNDKAQSHSRSAAERTERNKSPNLLTHFGNSKVSADLAAEGANGLYTPASGSSRGAISKVTNDLYGSEFHSMKEVPNTDLGLGSTVEVSIPEARGKDNFGVIRWIGILPGEKDIMIGVELDGEPSSKANATDGSYEGVSIFHCPPRHGVFVRPEQCMLDRRFDNLDDEVAAGPNGFASASKNDSMMFGHMECPKVPGAVAPLKIDNLKDLEEICGDFKGIQGHHNSCYLDATLFAMFTFTAVFDSLLFRPPDKEDITAYTEVQTVLREEIVNPLRKNRFVRADRVMKLRRLLDSLSSVRGLTSEEKDPEEFLNSLLAQIMRVEPFLKLNSGQDAYYYQLFVEKDERLRFPTVQQLFEQSFHSSDIKLKEVPSCLIIQMPRFGKDFKMYPRILPSQVLDVTDILEDSPRQCTVCGKLAQFECRDCFGNFQKDVGLESTAFCEHCLRASHNHPKRAHHKSRALSVPQDFLAMAEHTDVPRVYMELFAVVCIETSHYVAFVKAGSGPDAPWCFFDSMADRKGEQDGYNIPKIVSVPELPLWLSEEGSKAVNETSANEKLLPEHAKRLFCDAYMCMYQSTDVMMYR